jgi:hypothetical protein
MRNLDSTGCLEKFVPFNLTPEQEDAIKVFESEHLGLHSAKMLVAQIYREARGVTVVLYVLEKGGQKKNLKYRLRNELSIWTTKTQKQSFHSVRWQRNRMAVTPQGTLIFKIDGIKRTEQALLEVLGLNGFTQGVMPLSSKIQKHSSAVYLCAEAPRKRPKVKLL